MTVRTTYLGKVVDVSAGQPAPKPNDFSNEGYPFIRAGSLEGLLSGQTEDDCEKIDAETARKYRMRLYPKDTILFPKSGMSAKIGRVYRMRQSAYVVSHLAALAPTGRYDPSYLSHWLRAHPPSHLIKDDSYPSIRTSEVASLEVPDLHSTEQRRIAAILDKADAIRRKREQALALADEFLRSVFLEMFGDPVRNPKNFSVLPFSKLVTAIDSGLSPKCEARPATSEEFGVLKVSSVSSTQFRAEENKAVFPNFQPKSAHLIKDGDLLFSRKNTYELVGASALVEIDTENLALPDLIFRLVIDPAKVTKEFLWAMLVQPSMREQLRKIASGAAASMPNIGKGRLLELEVIAPEFQLQQDFSTIYAKSRSMLVNQKAHQTEATNLFAALSQRAFRGEL